MDSFLATIADIRDSRVGGGDCFCDRLNCKYTVYLMVVFSLIVTTRRYVGDQVSCWAPSHFTDSHRQYANQVSRHRVSSSSWFSCAGVRLQSCTFWSSNSPLCSVGLSPSFVSLRLSKVPPLFHHRRELPFFQRRCCMVLCLI
ncbi:hypothetical protein NP493_1216g00090 [Ridgeia piscesae]|uniref:Uncharacterized protein n=1 Tax=Ridgeia piscesae TaxID=27915 RepID=A0AAD9KCX0_RIDPI|nr:hypothetical protein NP493_1216g00090 [Ridgeia piscesae]